jgi:hypothetical protein
MRYFLSILAGVVAAAAIHASTFYASLGQTNSRDYLNVDSWYRHKSKIADSLTGPRIVIVAGSNALFGISARQIEDATGVPTVNYATHGMLTVGYHLYRARSVLRPGDTVLLALEYERYIGPSVNSLFSEYVLSTDPSYFHQLPLREKFEWIVSASIYKTAMRLIVSDEVQTQIATEIRAGAHTILNDRGDFTRNAKADQTEAQRLTVESHPPSFYFVTGHWRSRDHAWHQIGRFVRWCDDRGIRVLATFPNAAQSPEYETSRVRIVAADIEAHFAELGVPVLGTPEDAMFPREDYFDTLYHMTREGAEKRTAALLELLAPHLDAATRK